MPGSEKVIAVDLGTSYFKACRFNLDGNLESICTLPTPVKVSKGRAELSAVDFGGTLTRAIRHVAHVDGVAENIVALSFASQANSFALIDEYDQPLTPFVLWSDQRADRLNAPFYDFAADDSYRTRTGVPAVNQLFMPLKIRWLQENEANVVAKTQRIALLSDYFTWWLTGEWCSEASIASLSGIVDIHKLEWWTEACTAAAIPGEWLNRLVRTGEPLEHVRPKAAADLGLSPGCLFVAGCLDQHAGAIGVGNIFPGGISETTGTVLATVRCSSDIDRPPLHKVFEGPTFQEGTFYSMVFSEQSAGLLDRYRRDKAPQLTFAELDALADQSPPGARGLRLRDDAFRRPTEELFENPSAEQQPGDEVRAILEGVARQLSRQVDMLCGGRKPDVIYCAGGGAKSELWRKIKQQVLGIQIVATRNPEPTSFGAALLAISRFQGKPLVDLISLV